MHSLPLSFSLSLSLSHTHTHTHTHTHAHTHTHMHTHTLTRIHRRQSSDCFADFERYENDPTFVSCEAIAEEFEDNDVLSIDTVNRFCGKDCGNYLLKAFQKLTQDCDYIYTVSCEFVY